MAFAPIAYTIPQYENYAGWYLKAYEQGTTTPKNIATDSSGSTLLAKAQLDVEGFPITTGGARFIPHIDGDYDLWLFPTASDADNNVTANAIQLADNIDPPAEFDAKQNLKWFNSVADMVASTNLAIGDKALVLGYYSPGDGGGNIFEIVASGTGTADGGSYIDLTGISGQAKGLFVDGVVNVRQFGAKLDGVTDDSDAVNSAIAFGKIIMVPSGTCLIGSPISLSSNKSLRGDGVGKSIIKSSSSLGTNNMIDIADQARNIDICYLTFDGQNTVITPTFVDAYKENIINGKSNENVHIHHCEFVGALNRACIFDATLANPVKNIHVYNNLFRNGSRGGFFISRYAEDIHVHDNYFYNIVDALIGGIAFEKSISISGVRGCWIYNNNVVQDNSSGAAIIVEYKDRSSNDVYIYGNRVDYTGAYASDANNIKCGPCERLIISNNVCNNAGASGIYLEGVTAAKISNNIIYGSGKSAIALQQDADTLLYNNDVEVSGNYIKDANKNGAALGAPSSGGASNDSFAILQASQNDNDIRIIGNVFVDSGETFNGILVATNGDYLIRGNDFSGLNSNRITIDNHFSSSASYVISGNLAAKTEASGVATISSGQNSIQVDPGTLAVYNQYTTVTPITNLNNGILYVTAEPDVPPKFVVAAYNSVNSRTSCSSNISVSWRVDLSRVANGIFGKTAY